MRKTHEAWVVECLESIKLALNKSVLVLNPFFLVFVLCKLEDIKLRVEMVMVAQGGFFAGADYEGK